MNATSTKILQQNVILPDGEIGTNPVLEYEDGHIEDQPIPADPAADDESDLSDRQVIQETFGNWCYAEIYDTLDQWALIFSNNSTCFENWSNGDLALLYRRGHRVMIEIKKLPAKTPMKYCPGFTTRGEPYGIIQVNSNTLKCPLYVLLARLFCTMYKAKIAIEKTKKNSSAKSTVTKRHRDEMLKQYGIQISSSGKFLQYEAGGEYSFKKLLAQNEIACPDSFSDTEEVPTETVKASKTNWKALALELQAAVKTLEQQMDAKTTTEQQLATKIAELEKKLANANESKALEATKTVEEEKPTIPAKKSRGEVIEEAIIASIPTGENNALSMGDIQDRVWEQVKPQNSGATFDQVANKTRAKMIVLLSDRKIQDVKRGQAPHYYMPNNKE